MAQEQATPTEITQPQLATQQPNTGQIFTGQTIARQAITRQTLTPPINSFFSSRQNSNVSMANRATIDSYLATGINRHSGPGIHNSMGYWDGTAALDSHLMLRKALIEYLTGITFHATNIQTKPAPQKETDNGSSLEQSSSSDVPINSNALTFSGTLISEYEISSVSIGAQIVDDHGKTIDVKLSVVMERHYRESEADLRLRANRQMQDPLVINFNGEVVELGSNTVNFDINSDGVVDQIATFRSNSAYISLDKNGDGTINNGSELFGTQSGNGFSDLKNYDDDGNGFIDQADAVFSKLKAFNPETDSAVSLQSLGIAALALESTLSPFRLTDNQNNTLGQVRATGFYINEDGSADTLQQIDLVV